MSKNRTAVTMIVLAALVMLSPLLLNQQAILGVDGYFQYNRVYEAAMQIKHNNFSFINIYSFQQAGRVVNSLYSPLMTYLAGALLLLVGTWFRFQVVSAFLVLFISGFGMYRAGRKLSLPRNLAIALGIIFLSSNALYGFVIGITWRSIALGLLPLFVGPIIALYEGDWQLKSMLQLGLYLALLAQVQILATVIFIPFLIPFFCHGLRQSGQRANGLLNLLAGALFSLILSLNVILPILEVYGGNKLIAPTTMDLMDQVSLVLQPAYIGVDSSSDIVITVIVYALIMGLIVFWRRLGAFTKHLSIVSTTYVLVGTSLFPWDTIQTWWPYLQSFLQMPRRISLVGTPFLILATALVYYEAARNTENLKLQKNLTIASVFLGVLSLSLCTQKVARNVHYSFQEKTRLAEGLQTSPSNVVSKLKYMPQLQPDFHTRNLGKLITQVDRATPDYIPITHKIVPDDYGKVYKAYSTNFSKQRHHFHYQVVKNGVKLSWTAKHATTKSVPVVAYRRTQLVLNGHTLKSGEFKHKWIGNLSLKQRRGHNTLTVRYQKSHVTALGSGLTGAVWVIVVAVVCAMRIPLIKEM